MMKSFVLTVSLVSLTLVGVLGCGSSSTPTVNPAPQLTNEDFLQMEKDSAKSRAEAIADGA